jgi:glycerol-3-phosphate dehydrogenase
MFPGIRDYRVSRTYVGLRPTLFEYGPLEDKLSRDHAIIDHEAEGAPGLVTMIGGKLASYRVMSEEFADAVCARLGNNQPCRTHLEPLPGGEETPPLPELAAAHRISPYALERLAYRQGARTGAVLESAEEDSDLAAVCQCEPVTEAELRHCIRHEGARTLDDLRRRTRLAMGGCQGTRCIVRAGEILAEELGLTPTQVLAQLLDLLQQRFRGKAPALAGISLAQEELNQARHFLVADLGRQGAEPDYRATVPGDGWGDDAS